MVFVCILEFHALITVQDFPKSWLFSGEKFFFHESRLKCRSVGCFEETTGSSWMNRTCSMTSDMCSLSQPIDLCVSE